MGGVISERDMLVDGRAWINYPTDYRRMVLLIPACSYHPFSSSSTSLFCSVSASSPSSTSSSVSSLLRPCPCPCPRFRPPSRSPATWQMEFAKEHGIPVIAANAPRRCPTLCSLFLSGSNYSQVHLGGWQPRDVKLGNPLLIFPLLPPSSSSFSSFWKIPAQVQSADACPAARISISRGPEESTGFVLVLVLVSPAG
eukprot:752402-Hanusia_phi.AAC.6